MAKRTPIFIILALMALVLSLRFWHAPRFPYYEDEIITIKAAEGIVKHGIPLVYTDKLYNRSPLYHYLLAIPLKIWGAGSRSSRSLSIVFSVLMLGLIYLMGRDLGDVYTGIVSALLLACLSYEIQYALSARFYMIFQFFYVLTVFLFYKGFIENNYLSENPVAPGFIPGNSGEGQAPALRIGSKTPYKIWAILSFLATIFTHQLSFELVPAIILFLIITQRERWLKDKYIITGCIVAGLAFYFTIFYHPSNQWVCNSTDPLIAGNLLNAKDSGMNNIFCFTAQLNRIILHGFSLIILGILFLLRERNKLLFYYYVMFFVSLTVITLVSPDDSENYIFNIFPLYVLLVSYVAVRISKSGLDWGKRIISETFGPNLSRSTEWGIYTIILLSAFLFLAGVFERKLGFSSSYPNLQPAHIFIQEHFKPDDLIVSTNPLITDIYLRFPDYFLRQKLLPNGDRGEFEFDKNDMGIYMVDSVSDLQKLINNSKSSIWIMADKKFNLYLGDDLISFVRRNFNLVYNNRKANVAIYLRERPTLPYPPLKGGNS